MMAIIFVGKSSELLVQPFASRTTSGILVSLQSILVANARIVDVNAPSNDPIDSEIILVIFFILLLYCTVLIMFVTKAVITSAKATTMRPIME